MDADFFYLSSLHIFEQPSHIFILDGLATPYFAGDGAAIFKIENIVLQALHKMHIDDGAAVHAKKIGLSQSFEYLGEGAIFLDNATGGIKKAILVLYLHHDNLGRI